MPPRLRSQKELEEEPASFIQNARDFAPYAESISVMRSYEGLRLIFTFSHDCFTDSSITHCISSFTQTSLSLVRHSYCSASYCSPLIPIRCYCSNVLMTPLHSRAVTYLLLSLCLTPALSTLLSHTIVFTAFFVLSSLLFQYVFKPSTYHLASHLDLFVVGTRYVLSFVLDTNINFVVGTSICLCLSQLPLPLCVNALPSCASL